MPVYEGKWRVVDDVGRDDKGMRVVDLMGDHLRDSVVVNPELLVNQYFVR